MNFIAKGSKTFSSVRNESYVELTLNNIFTSKIHTLSVYSSPLTFSNPQATFKQENSHFSENKRNLFILLSVRLFMTKREINSHTPHPLTVCIPPVKRSVPDSPEYPPNSTNKTPRGAAFASYYNKASGIE